MEIDLHQAKIHQILCCPICKQALLKTELALFCCNETCKREYKIINGIPDMLCEDNLQNYLLKISDNNLGKHQLDSAEEFETDFNYSSRTRGVLEELYVDYSFALRKQIVTQLSTTLGRKLDILDIGSGSLIQGTGGQGGRHFQILQEFSSSYTAIDPSWEIIERVNIPNSNLNYLPDALLARAVGEMLPFNGDLFDLALFISVLDHTVSPKYVLMQTKSVLRSGGMVLILLQNYQSWQKRFAKFLFPNYMKKREEQDHHSWHLTPSLTTELLKAAGFTNIFCIDLMYFSIPRKRLENLLFQFPVFLLGKSYSRRMVEITDQKLSKLFSGSGGEFIICASKE